MSKKNLRIGKIVGFHGLQGDVKVKPYDNEPTWVDSLKNITLVHHQDEKNLRIEKARLKQNVVIMRFEGLASRNAVEPYRNAELYADKDDIGEPQEGAYWIDDLIGLTVIGEKTGKPLGSVKDLISSTGKDFLEIQSEKTGELEIIPFDDHFFPSIDLKTKTILAAHLDGFFDSEEKLT